MFQAMFYSKQQNRNISRSYENGISESEQNNSQLWRVQAVDKDIMSLSTVLNSNLAHTAQVLTIKQQSLAKIISPLVVEVSILLLASQLKFVFNKIAHHIFIYVGHERRGLVFHEYAWFNRIEQIITDKKRHKFFGAKLLCIT